MGHFISLIGIYKYSGNINCHIAVILQSHTVPPEVVSIEEVDPVTAFRDRNVTLNFAINKASPEVDPADIIWTFQQQRSNETVTLDADNPHYQFSSDRRSLRIVDLSTNDIGAYTLIARNPAGIKSGIIDLDVQGIMTPY